MNLCVLMGRLTSNVELKTTTNGVSVAAFSVAVDRKYTPQGQERQTDFINCVAWRNTAEFVSKWFGKGDMIAIVGEIQTRKYTDKNGNNRVAVEVVVNEARFCGRKNEAQQNNESENTPPASDGFTDVYADDDLPF